MLVYGDRSENADPQLRLGALGRSLDAVAAQPPGLDRHSALVALLIEAGQLLQGVADADHAGVGHRSGPVEKLGDFLHALARAACRSWDSRFAELAPLPPVPRIDGLPSEVELRTPEGYAYYALYPEAYIEAARKLELTGPPCVIGLRSIGTSLAAVAAAAIGASRPATVRPIGDPFRRCVAIAPDLADALLARPDAHYIIVDEGPGQSGSSFGAAADWLEQRGVAPHRIAFLPSHGGDLGPQASAAHRARWAGAQRVTADLAPHLSALLADWAALDRLPEDISAGAWRAWLYRDEHDWPAVDPARERRKYLGSANGKSWLLKFAGLGEEGTRKLARARLLHAAGFAPEPRGLVHGFLIERWHGETEPLRRAPPLDRVAAYIGARARLLPGAPESGASVAELLNMGRRNTELALGPAAAAAFGSWEKRLPELSRCVVRVETDNRLDIHEWLALPEGRLLKADALDHHAGHDLIGCQDIAWDVAGATIEFDLDERSAATFAAQVERAAGKAIEPILLEFLTLAYLAFRLGETSLAAEALPPSSPESARLNRRTEAYAARLERALAAADRALPASRFGSDFRQLIPSRNEPHTEPSRKSAVTWGVDEEA